jgi:hypothetical protein
MHYVSRRSALALLASVPLTGLVAGCATSRSELRIDLPSKGPTLAAGAPVIIIRAITDERVFEDAPKSANIPSLGIAEAGTGKAPDTKAQDAVKARAIGRKRNGYGKALGDVLLDGGQTVAGVMRDSLAAAFADAGYAVKPDPAPGAITVDVRIRQMWAWTDPTFTVINTHMDMDIELVFSGRGGKHVITVRATEGRAVVGDDGWRDIIQKGLADFRKQATDKAKALPR